MNTFMELARARHSVRRFEDTAIPDEMLYEVLEAGRISPTAGNLSPQRIYVVKSEEMLKHMRALSPCCFNAPIVLVFSFDRTKDWKNTYEKGLHSGVQDVSIAATHIMLAACDRGLSTCWVNAFSPSAVHEALGLSHDEEIVCMMPLGFELKGATPSRLHTERRALDEFVSIV